MDRVKRQIAVVIAKCAKKVAEANVNSCCMYVMLFFVKYFSLKKASEFPFFSKGFSLPSAGIMHPCA